MAAIFRETTVSWDGKEYTFVPDMNLLRRIEGGNEARGVAPVSLSHLAHSAGSGKPQFGVMTWVMEVVMREAGVPGFTDEIAYQAFHGADSKDVVALWLSLTEALSPIPKAQKKAVAPESA